jgi:hypothetical protein
VFAEESYLFDEIGQACHLAVRPRFECERAGEGEKRMVQSGRRVGTSEPLDPVVGGSATMMRSATASGVSSSARSMSP